MTKTTVRHRAPLTTRGRLTRLWSTVSALPVGALAGCVAVGVAAATSSPEAGALGLGVAMAPAALTTWRSRFTGTAPGHGRRSSRPGAARHDATAAAQARRVERTLAPRPSTVPLGSLLDPPPAQAPTGAADAPVASAARPAEHGPRVVTGRGAADPSPPRPLEAGSRGLLALGATAPAARTPIVLDVPDLAALHAATGQEHVWRGRTPRRAEDDPSRLFTVSSSGGAVEIVVLTRAERAARDLEALSAMEEATDAADAPAPAVMVRTPATRAQARARRRPRPEDGLADAA